MNTEEPNVATAPPSLADEIAHTLRESDHPLTAKQLAKALSPADGKRTKQRRQEVEEALRKGAESGRFFRWPSKGKQPRYWTRDVTEYAEERAGELLQAGDLPRSKLAARIGKSLLGVPPTERRGLIDRMIESGRLHLIGRGRGAKVSRERPRPPDAVDLLRKRLGLRTFNRMTGAILALAHEGTAIEETLESLRRHLVARADNEPTATPEPALSTHEPAPAPESEVERLILRGMPDLNPDAETGAPVALADLRRHLPEEYRSPDVFDRAVRRLLEAGRVEANPFEVPDDLGEEQKRAFVRDDQGRYIARIALKVRSAAPAGA
jgi:hypothetical protein